MTAEEHCSHATNPHKASQTPVVRTKLQLNKFGFDKKNKLKKICELYLHFPGSRETAML